MTSLPVLAQILLAAGHPSPVRTPRGRDILAACGQLKSASERLGWRGRAAPPAAAAEALPAAAAQE